MAVGETILSAFLEVLFEQMLSSGGRQFLKLIGGVDLPKTIQKWKIQFTRLEALLDDAELQQFHSKPVKLWLNDLQDLAYDIEDLLDHFATEALGYQLKKAEEDEAYAVIDHSNAGILDRMAQTICVSGSRAADSLSTFLKPVDQRIRDKIDDITERLQDIQDQTQSLSLTAAHMMQQQTLQTETLRSQRESTSLVGQVFGRDDMKEEIITMLLKDDQNAVGYVVIPIVGTGGIGKTTLAQYVYNDEQMYVYRGEQLYAHNGEQQKSNFDSKAWVCVSDVFDVKRVTIDIIKSATRSNDFNCSNLDQAQLKLQEVLKGKKFFIVLDDIWSEEYGDWDKLQEPFRHGAKGSRVILTTRTKSIAMMMVTNPTQRDIIKLERLSNVDSWLIFQQHAKEDSDLAEMRDNIVEKINGLPLAAKALGGLLKSIPDKSQRRKILESNVWAEKSSVLPVLRLSYHHMPSHLKRVFAYCSVFPKDYVFKETELVLLWMAQGFLPETQNERMEDMGHKYFNDLVSRSLFEKPPSSVKDDTFIMHDLIHDVAQLAAGDVCYIMDSKRDDLERVRHLFVNRHVHTLGDDLERVPQLRSFLCHNNYLRVDNLDTIQRMHYIRALYLASNIIKVLPEYIGDLKHLRYLSLNFRNIQVLPHSINNLWNLQTLGLNWCLNLEKVPNIGSLEKLRHIYLVDTLLRPRLKEMPLGIGRLTNLQTLGEFVLAPGGGSRVRELGMLNHLRGRLCLLGLENVTEVADAEEAQLHKKEGLDELYMNWGTCVDEVGDMTKRDVIEKLQPHTSIKKCKLEGYMGTTLPSWLGDTSFSNMVDITLWECQKCECLPPLGQLPSLKGLWIEDMGDGIKEVGLEFYGHCSNPFPSLKTLSFYGVISWEKWVHPPVDNKAFPILEELHINECPSLQGNLPPHLPSLRELEIIECRQLQTLELKSSSSTCLEKLHVEGCDSIVFTCEQQSLLLPALEYLRFVDCKNMERLPAQLHNLTSLQRLDIEECPKIHWLAISPHSVDSVECIPCPYLSLPSSLSQLYIQGLQNLRTISFLGNFTSLVELSIENCPKFHEFPQGGLPKNLSGITIRGTNIDKPIKEWGLHLLSSLHYLKLANVGSSVDTVECITYSDLPSSLKRLKIEGFQNLKTIYCSTLPRLSKLSIHSCPKFESFGDNGYPPRLYVISIKQCNIIEQKLRSDPNGIIETENGKFSLP